MLVSLTMRITEASGYKEHRDSISHDWLDRLDTWGMTPLLLPNRGNPDAMLERFGPDLIVLTGGDDLGETPDRDVMERRLLEYAIAHRYPALGVCRGMQLINDRFDGAMAALEGHVATRHPIVVDAAWAEFYGEGGEVNSYHRLGVRPQDLGASLVATAHDDTGNIEAFQHAELPIAAVMWHPEREGAPAGDQMLMRSLAARKGAP